MARNIGEYLLDLTEMIKREPLPVRIKAALVSQLNTETCKTGNIDIDFKYEQSTKSH